MTSLAEIRAKLAQQNQQFTPGSSQAIYPHWNIESGENVTLRFLPDGDEDNVFFWRERQMLRFPFIGVKGDPGSKGISIQVPCMEMWEAKDSCPVLREVRTWFKDSSMEDMGRKYWKKRSYIFQGFIVGNNPLDEETPENPVRRFVMGPQLFEKIKDALTDEDLEELPTDFEEGLDFIIKKTTKGDWANYDTSKWARKERALTDEERAGMKEYGLFNLVDFMPNKPDASALTSIVEMFEASVDGQSFDMDRWGSFARNVDGKKTDKSDSKAASAEDKAEDKEPGEVVKAEDKEVSEPTVKKKGNQNILDMIAARKKKQNA